MNKPAPRFRPISGPLDVSDDALDKLGDELGVPSLVKPEQPPAPPPLSAPAPSPANPPRVTASVVSKAPRPTVPVPVPVSVEERAATSLEKISLELPGYLTRAMRMRVAEEGTTLRYLTMQGLQAIGFTIDDCDFVTDGRSFRAKPR